LSDYNRCVEENIKLKETNERLMRKKANVEAKYEIVQRKLDQMLAVGYIDQSQYHNTFNERLNSKLPKDPKVSFLATIQRAKEQKESLKLPLDAGYASFASSLATKVASIAAGSRGVPLPTQSTENEQQH
jgi:hypothetical protein